MLIPGVDDNELERLHWKLREPGGAQALRHIPSGILIYRKYGPNVDVRQVSRELTVELQQKLRQIGFLAGES